MSIKIQRINLSIELTKLCKALLTIQMDEQDRQTILNVYTYTHMHPCSTDTFSETQTRSQEMFIASAPGHRLLFM